MNDIVLIMMISLMVPTTIKFVENGIKLIKYIKLKKK